MRTAISQAATAAAEGKRALASAIAVETTWTTFEKDAAEGVGGRLVRAGRGSR